MGAGEAKSLPALGFLTVVDNPEWGLIGGYLLLNLAGRPLEFHCTAPIKPNRAQQILYGPTLEPYLYGEQVGASLVNKSGMKPLVVCTDSPPALALREHVALPVVLVLPTEDTAEGTDGVADLRHDAAHGRPPLPALARFRQGRNQLAIPAAHGNDREQVASRLQSLDEAFDLAEPFTRIREAIEEAQRGSR